jgi:hypothetical protein
LFYSVLLMYHIRKHPIINLLLYSFEVFATYQLTKEKYLNPITHIQKKTPILLFQEMGVISLKMAEAERFELSRGYAPPASFQDWSLQPLG